MWPTTLPKRPVPAKEMPPLSDGDTTDGESSVESEEPPPAVEATEEEPPPAAEATKATEEEEPKVSEELVVAEKDPIHEFTDEELAGWCRKIMGIVDREGEYYTVEHRYKDIVEVLNGYKFEDRLERLLRRCFTDISPFVEMAVALPFDSMLERIVALHKEFPDKFTTVSATGKHAKYTVNIRYHGQGNRALTTYGRELKVTTRWLESGAICQLKVSAVT